jgi:uncharacterized protein with von Willebrand factor type A (vWA) domain
MRHRLLRVFAIICMLALLVCAIPAASREQDTDADVVEAVKLTRDSEKEKSRGIDTMLSRLSSRPTAKRVLEAVRKNDREELSRLIAAALRGSDADATVEQVQPDPFCMRLRVKWHQPQRGTSDVAIGCQ